MVANTNELALPADEDGAGGGGGGDEGNVLLVEGRLADAANEEDEDEEEDAAIALISAVAAAMRALCSFKAACADTNSEMKGTKRACEKRPRVKGDEDDDDDDENECDADRSAKSADILAGDGSDGAANDDDGGESCAAMRSAYEANESGYSSMKICADEAAASCRKIWCHSAGASA